MGVILVRSKHRQRLIVLSVLCLMIVIGALSETLSFDLVADRIVSSGTEAQQKTHTMHCLCKNIVANKIDHKRYKYTRVPQLEDGYKTLAVKGCETVQRSTLESSFLL